MPQATGTTTTVRVHGRARMTNGYYFVHGLRQVYGSRVRWVGTGLPGTPPANYSLRFVLAEIVDGGQRKRVVFDYGDSAEIDEDVLAWSDTYGKINCTAKQRQAGVVPIGPAFSIRPATLPAIWLATKGVAGTARDVGLKSLIAERRNFVLRTAMLNEFSPGEVVPGFFFYRASLWEYANCLDTVNPLRAEWMRAAKQNPQISFEGGFMPFPSSPEGPARGLQVEQFADLVEPGFLPLRQWIRKTQQSVAVFNSPAVDDCLGWKLGQYLALGKAIVSTPLTREMPEPLAHGRHVHFINSPEEIPAVQALLLNDAAYRRRLESGARRYWEQHLTPEVIVRSVVRGGR